MVKRRESPILKRQATEAEIESFVSGADQGYIKMEKKIESKLNPNANRNFKAIRVPFNEYEYNQLNRIAIQTGRTKLNAIRWAILKFAEDLKK